MATKKLSGKILCLHGFAQDADTFKAKSSGLRKALKKIGLETHYLNAPVTFLPADLPFDLSASELSKLGTDANKKEYRGWWKKGEQGYSIDESLASIRECAEQEGPFVGILGFSQGAGLGGLVAQNFDTLFPGQPALKFAIFFSGFKISDNDRLLVHYEPKIAIPTLHVIGELDTVVSMERSMKLHDECCEPHSGTVYKHPGGHFVPNAKGFVEKVIAWIYNQMEPKQGATAGAPDAAGAVAGAVAGEASSVNTASGTTTTAKDEVDDILALIENLGKH